jgi:hypothetical protein
LIHPGPGRFWSIYEYEFWTQKCYGHERARVLVFNATFNNISVISWWSVLLVEETGVPGENHRPVASHWQTLSHNVVSSTPRHEQVLNTDSIGSCKSNYHTIMTTTTPDDFGVREWILYTKMLWPIFLSVWIEQVIFGKISGIGIEMDVWIIQEQCDTSMQCNFLHFWRVLIGWKGWGYLSMNGIYK